jgi:hypothetical protein
MGAQRGERMIAEAVVMIIFLSIFFYIVYTMEDGRPHHVPEPWDISFNKVSTDLDNWSKSVFEEEE